MEPSEYDAMHQAEDCHWWYRALRAVLESFLRQYSPKRRQFALDVGCGTGGTLRNVNLGENVIGLDASSMALGFCQRDGLRLLARGSANLLPFRSDIFEAVVSFDVLCHKSVRPFQALREIRRVMKPEGTFLMNLPALDVLKARHDLSVHTAHRFTRGQVVNLLRRAGLKVERVTYWNFILFPLEFAYRLVNKYLMAGSKARSEVAYCLPILHAVLYAIVRLEARAVIRVSLPVGLSVFSVARRTR